MHWDLCLDTGSVLVTWQLLRDPRAWMAADAPDSLPARRIADHRRAYLDYEGPISRNRGEVQRVECGNWQETDRSEVRWRIRLEGTWLNGMFLLESGSSDDPQDAWQLRKVT